MRHDPILLPRRSLLLGAALAPFAAWANENWPSRPIRVIVPTFPGSPPDVAMRAIADQIEKQLGQPIVVENKGGAQGTIGMSDVARAEPDGYTFGLINLQSTATPALRKTPYDLRTSFTPVSQLTTESPVLVVSNKLPVKDMKSLVDHVRKHPGQLSYGSSGSGTPSHLGMELMLREIGGKVTHIPYKGTAAAGTDVAGGQIEMALVGSAVAGQLLQGSRVRAIAVSSEKRLRGLPEVPTLAEAGFAQIDLRGWVGLVGPAGLPPAIVNRMQAAVVSALEAPAVQARLDTTGATAAPSKPDAFGAFIAREAQRWQKIVADANIRFD